MTRSSLKPDQGKSKVAKFMDECRNLVTNGPIQDIKDTLSKMDEIKNGYDRIIHVLNKYGKPSDSDKEILAGFSENPPRIHATTNRWSDFMPFVRNLVESRDYLESELKSESDINLLRDGAKLIKDMDALRQRLIEDFTSSKPKLTQLDVIRSGLEETREACRQKIASVSQPLGLSDSFAEHMRRHEGELEDFVKSYMNYQVGEPIDGIELHTNVVVPFNDPRYGTDIEGNLRLLPTPGDSNNEISITSTGHHAFIKGCAPFTPEVSGTGIVCMTIHLLNHPRTQKVNEMKDQMIRGRIFKAMLEFSRKAHSATPLKEVILDFSYSNDVIDTIKVQPSAKKAIAEILIIAHRLLGHSNEAPTRAIYLSGASYISTEWSTAVDEIQPMYVWEDFKDRSGVDTVRELLDVGKILVMNNDPRLPRVVQQVELNDVIVDGMVSMRQNLKEDEFIGIFSGWASNIYGCINRASNIRECYHITIFGSRDKLNEKMINALDDPNFYLMEYFQMHRIYSAKLNLAGLEAHHSLRDKVFEIIEAAKKNSYFVTRVPVGVLISIKTVHETGEDFVGPVYVRLVRRGA